MKREKSILTILVMAVLMTAVLTACGEPETTYTFWTATMTQDTFNEAFGETITFAASSFYRSAVEQSPAGSGIWNDDVISETKRDGFVTNMNGEKHEFTDETVFKEEATAYLNKYGVTASAIAWLLDKERSAWIAVREGSTNNIHVIIK